MKQVQHLGPVCALKILSNNLILSGNGPTLSIHDYTTGEKLFERLIFKRNKIHGIDIFNSASVDESKIQLAIWGGRSLSIFTLEDLKNLKKELPHFGVGDWIFHCLFENSQTLHVLNSHNVVHTISVTSEIKLVQSRDCNWKSILYSGNLHFNKETGKITVLAGTVMNGIVIWDLESMVAKHNLTLHEGAIFNVIASPNGKFVISCSDDRSIKVWDMETGNLLSNGWGHGSRIWGLNVFNYDALTDEFNIFSCSEDCTARIWKFAKNQDELKQERIILNHTGRHVWSCAVNDNLKLGFTSGADGKIVVNDLNETERVGYYGNRWELKQISDECKYDFKKNELIKEYVDFGYGLLAITSEGKVMVLKDYKNWIPLFVDPRFERFCILKIFENESICVLGNKLGDVILMKFNERCEVIVQNEITLSDSFDRLGNILVHKVNGNLFTLFESPNPKDPLIYKEIDFNTLEVKSGFILHRPNDKISVSSVEYNLANNYLLVGCRFATLLLYKIDNALKEFEPLNVYKNLFKGDTISSLKPLENSKDCIFYLTNRDGTYHLMKIKCDLSYEFLHSSKIQKGFLEGILKLPNNDILFYGFKSDSFFVWNETKQYEIMREICGGPHRRWFFKHWINSKDNTLKYRFTYTRANEVQIVQNGESGAVEVLSTGLHGREIRDICIVDSKTSNTDKIVISGSEDTTLKIGALKPNGDYKLHWTYREHVAGLQSIHKINNEYIMSSSAREELFIWKINECDDKKCLNLESSLPPSDENPDLRIMDFDTIEIFNQNNEVTGVLLVSVYSNSVIRIVSYDFSRKRFEILVSNSYMQCCIFHVKFICLDNKLYILIGSTNGHIAIYDINDIINESFNISTVNSEPKLIKIVEEIKTKDQRLNKLIVNQQLHQSSFKGLDTIQLSPSSIKLITAGDDNALIVSEIEKNSDNEINVRNQSFNPSAASSTITTVKVIDENTVMVGAVDQSIKLWNVDAELKVLENNYTTVADVGCSEISTFESGEKYALIGGAGFSIWEI